MEATRDSLRALGRDPARATLFTAHDARPELASRHGLARLLERHYPADLKRAGIGGTTVVWTLIDAEGTVRATEIARGSRYPAIDRAAVAALAGARFSPAVREGCRTAAWIELPITFAVVNRQPR